MMLLAKLRRTATERSRRLDWRDVESGVKRLLVDHLAEQTKKEVKDRQTTKKKREKREDLDGDNEERESGFFLGHQEDTGRLICEEYREFSLFVTREMPLQVDDLSETLRSGRFSGTNSTRLLDRLVKQLHQCVNLHAVEEVDFEVPRRSKGDSVFVGLERDQWEKAAKVRRAVRLFVSSVEYAVTQFVEEFRTIWHSQDQSQSNQRGKEEEEEKEQIMREVHSFLFRTRLLNHQHRILWNAPRTLLDHESIQDHKPMIVVHCDGYDVLPVIRHAIYDAEGLAIEKYGVTGDPIKLFLDGHDLSLDPSKEKIVSLPFMIPSYLQFSLMELLKNALRSSVDSGLLGETISVQVDTKSSPDKVQISVEDRGRGFQSQEHCNQAQRFFSTSFVPDQPTYTYSGNFGAQMHGLGMGLPLSRLHIESLHGSLCLSSSNFQSRTLTSASISLPTSVPASAFLLRSE